jgi:hypothetical protein
MDTAVVGCRPNTGSLLKEPFKVFSSLLLENPGFRMATIFKGLQPSEVVAHSCATGGLPKDRILQRAAGQESGQANSD